MRRTRTVWLLPTVAVVVVALAIAAWLIVDEQRSARVGMRRQVSPGRLLYPQATLDAAGFRDATVQIQAQRAPFGHNIFYKRWGKAGSQGYVLEQQAQAHSDPASASRFFRADDPRKASLIDNSGAQDVVGPAQTIDTPGADNAQIYCANLMDPKVEASSCTSWVWWARYGQYTVKISVSTAWPVVVLEIPRGEFDRIVDLFARNVSELLAR